MRKTVVLLLLLGLTLTAPVGRASSFWDTVGNVIDTACRATNIYNVGENWQWLCTLRGIYSNIRWVIENFNEYATDVVIQMFTGTFEGVMQQVGWVMGPGVNQFMDEVSEAVKNIRNAPYQLRNLIVKAALDEAKKKYTPLTGAPPGTPRASLDEKTQYSPSVAWGFMGEFLREWREGMTRAGMATQMAENFQAVQEANKAVQTATEQALLVVPPKEGEGAGLRQGVAEKLEDEARSAASSREVMEVLVKGVANLLRLQATSNQALIGQVTNTLNTQLLTNGSLVALYDKLAEQAEREATEAIGELEAWASAIDEEVQMAGMEIERIGDVFTQIGDMVNNVPNLGNFLQ